MDHYWLQYLKTKSILRLWGPKISYASLFIPWILPFWACISLSIWLSEFWILLSLSRICRPFGSFVQFLDIYTISEYKPFCFSWVYSIILLTSWAASKELFLFRQGVTHIETSILEDRFSTHLLSLSVLESIFLTLKGVMMVSWMYTGSFAFCSSIMLLLTSRESVEGTRWFFFKMYCSYKNCLSELGRPLLQQ